jgi:hypothetical protein
MRSTGICRKPPPDSLSRPLAYIQYTRQVHGLGEKPKGAALHRFFEQVIGAVARHEVDFGVHAILARHHHVKEAEVKGLCAIGVNSFLAAVGDLHLVVIQGQELRQRVCVFSVVIEYKYGKCPRPVRPPPLVFQ